MTPEESVEFIVSIRVALEAKDLTWLIREVDEAIRLGKPVMRSIVINKESLGDSSSLVIEDDSGVPVVSGARTRKKTRVPTTVGYSPAEQVELFLQAIERTVVAVQQMRSELSVTLSKSEEQHPGIGGIRFEREGGLSTLISLREDEQSSSVQGVIDAIKMIRERS